MRNHFTKAFVLMLGLTALFGGTLKVEAQRVVSLVGLTNFWRYNQDRIDLPTTWKTNNFDDNAWPGGLATLGFEPGNPGVYPAPFNTALTRGPENDVTVTFYFRTHFNYFASDMISGLTLLNTNWMDDGAVIYINGLEAGRFRVPAAQTYAIQANAQPAAEGTNEVLNISTNFLRIGDNVVAVEVHQNGLNSSDLAWNMRLLAIVPTVLAITNQPQSSTNPVGSTASFTVGISGGPVTTYTWQKEVSPNNWGQPNPAPQNLPAYTIPLLTTNHAGNYRVIAAGQLNSVTSIVARLVVIADTVGPVMLTAQPGSFGSPTNYAGGTNRIIIRWSELLNSASAVQTNNYIVRMFPQTNIVVPIFSIIYSSSNSILNMDTNANWFVGVSNYYITVSNVRDTSGNVVAPNSQVALAWPAVTNVIPAFWAWDYNPNYVFENPATNDPPWYATNFVESFWWAGPAPAVFGYDPIDPLLITCIGTEQTRIQPEGSRPTYFRTTFNWPYAQVTAELRLRSVVDDGLALYLNGNEIYRYNVPAAPTVLDGDTLAVVNVADGDCRTNTIPGMHTIRSGVNYLAAAVYQSNATGNEYGDLTFALELDTVSLRVGGLPTNPPPRINLTSMRVTNVVNMVTSVSTNMVMSWTNSAAGWALEYLTDTSKTAKRGPGNTNYFIGDWSEVQTNMSNPFTNTVYPGSVRIFRLRKAQVQ